MSAVILNMGEYLNRKNKAERYRAMQRRLFDPFQHIELPSCLDVYGSSPGSAFMGVDPGDELFAQRQRQAIDNFIHGYDDTPPGVA